MPTPLAEMELSRELTSDITRLLETVIWGTEGARYKLCDVDQSLEHLPPHEYLSHFNQGTRVGTGLSIEKRTQWNGGRLHCFYYSFFAVDPRFQGQGIGKLLARETWNELRARLQNPGLLYCHVETDNHRSLRIFDAMGGERAGRFHVMSFSRFFPKPSTRLRKIRPPESGQVLTALSTLYTGHAMTDFDLSLRPESYYVLAEGDRLLAGLQVESQRWQILSLAGFGGSIAIHVLPYVPLVRDLFNPNDFRFLKMGNLFFPKDKPEMAFELLEAVLANHGRKTMMMFWDKTSPVFQLLDQAGRWGALNALTETPVEILAFWRGVSDADRQQFTRLPKVISPCDI